MILIVTGVSGTGKTTIGQLLASHFKLPFYDADGFHPAENIEKMSNGVPLDDSDRIPWLENLAALLKKSQQEGGAVLACSALKEAYRKMLQVDSDLFWIHLKGEKQLIWDRMLARKNHYMKAGMLDSQFETWEEPNYGLKLDINLSPEEMIANALQYLEKEMLKLG